MTEKEARDLLQPHVDKMNLDPYCEDDDGKLTGGWHSHIGEMVEDDTTNYLTGGAVPPDEGAIYFIVYTLPQHISFDEIEKMPEEEKDEYGSLWAVGADGRAYMPEA